MKHGRGKRVLACLMSWALAFGMMPTAALAKAAEPVVTYDDAGEKVKSIDIGPYSYVDHTEWLGGENHLQFSSLQGIVNELSKSWAPIAGAIFLDNGKAANQNFDITVDSDDDDDSWAELFGNVRNDDDGYHVDVIDSLSGINAKPKNGVTGVDRFNADAKLRWYRDMNGDLQVATTKDDISWYNWQRQNTYMTSGLQYATSLNDVALQMADSVRIAAKNDYYQPTGEDWADKIYSQAKISALKSDEGKRNTQALYRYVTALNFEDGEWFYNSYALVFYDFSLAPMIVDGVKAANEKVVNESETRGKSVVTNYFENKSRQDSDVSASIGTSGSESISNSLETTESFTHTSEWGVETKVGTNDDVTGWLVSLEVTAHKNFGTEESISTAWGEEKSIERSLESGSEASIGLPPHTGVALEQSAGEFEQTVSYDCPVALNYKVAVISLSGSDDFDYVRSLVATFGSGSLEGGMYAPQNLYVRAVDPATRNKMESSYGNVEGVGQRASIKALNWDSLAATGIDSLSAHIAHASTQIPLFSAGGAITLTRNTKNTELGEVQPLYRLSEVKIDEGDDFYEMMPGDKLSLAGLTVGGYNRYGVPYYGFDSDDGQWVLDEDNSDPGVATVTTSPRTGRVTVKANKPGLACLKWVLSDDAKYQAREDEKRNTFVTATENAPEYPLIEIEVGAAEDVYRVEVTGEPSVGVNEELGLTGVLKAAVYDAEDSIISRSVTYEPQDKTGLVSIEDNVFKATEPGDYKVRAVYANSIQTVKSGWVTVHVTTAPTIESIEADKAELSPLGGEVKIAVTGKNLEDGIEVSLTDAFGNNLTAKTTGTDTKQVATFTLSANSSFTSDAVYAASCVGSAGPLKTDVTVKARVLTKVDAVDATCTEDGSIDYWVDEETGDLYADAAGTKKITQKGTVVEALGHELQKVDAIAATCEDEGNSAYYECTRCGELFSDAKGRNPIDAEDAVIDALGHDWDGGKVTTEPTCEQEGERTFTCKHDPTHTYTESIDALGHDWNEGVVTTQPTCETAGEKTFTCKNDATHTKVEAIAPLGHDWDQGVITTAPTCDADGELTFTCANDKSHTRTQAIDKLGHDWGAWTETKAATETEEGEEQRVCKNDPTHVETRAIPKLDHQHTLVHVPAEAATCETAGNIEHWRCSDCGKFYTDAAGQSEIQSIDTIIQATGHSWGAWTETKAATETTEGEEQRVCKNDSSHIEVRDTPTTAHVHSGRHVEAVQATCMVDGMDEYWVCDGCKQRFSDAACKTRVETEDLIRKALGHDWDEGVVTTAATCEADGIRTFTCKNDAGHSRTEIIDKLGHDWDEGVITTAPTCEADGELTFTCKNDATHTQTQVIDKLGHDWDEGVVTTAATCEAEGVKTFTCKNDADHTRTETIAALGHDWGEGVVTTPATCEAPGERTFTCKHDKTHTYTEAIDKLGHDWSDWTVTKPATTEEAGEEQRVCKNDPTHVETRAIDKLPASDDQVPSYYVESGDKASYTVESGEDLTFVFKRNTNDDETFDHFIGLKLDGVDYDGKAERGSVKVTIPAAELDKLSAGEHTLTALFDDADEATATFTVKAKSDDGKTDDGKTDDGSNNGKTDDGKTDDGKTDDGSNNGKTDDGKGNSNSGNSGKNNSGNKGNTDNKSNSSKNSSSKNSSSKSSSSSSSSNGTYKSTSSNKNAQSANTSNSNGSGSTQTVYRNSSNGTSSNNGSSNSGTTPYYDAKKAEAAEVYKNLAKTSDPTPVQAILGFATAGMTMLAAGLRRRRKQ